MATDGVFARLCVILYLVMLYSSLSTVTTIVPATTRTCLTAPLVFEEGASKAVRPARLGRSQISAMFDSKNINRVVQAIRHCHVLTLSSW